MKNYTVSDFKDVLFFIENKDYQRAYDLLFETHTYLKNVLHQESAHIMYYIGYCQECLNNPYGAIEWLNRALEIDSYNYHYASFRSGCLCEIEESIEQLIPFGIEKLADVEKIYQYLIKEGHVRSNLQFNMIRFYIKINDLETAHVMLENFLERNPNDSEAKFIHSSLKSYGVKSTHTKPKTIRVA